MALLDTGSPAPRFTAATSGGGTVDSASWADPVVLVFYPGDNTPG